MGTSSGRGDLSDSVTEVPMRSTVDGVWWICKGGDSVTSFFLIILNKSMCLAGA